MQNMLEMDQYTALLLLSLLALKLWSLKAFSLFIYTQWETRNKQIK